MPRDGIILCAEGTLYGEDCKLLEKEGWLVACPNDTIDLSDPPCGFYHRGDGFYHLAKNVRLDDLPNYY